MIRNDRNIRILVADDNELMRNGLCALLRSRPGWVVCGEAHDGQDALEKAIALQPDVVLADISMPQLNGFEAARSILAKVPRAEILIVTEHDSRTLAHMPLPAGVRGYLMKSQLHRDLIPAVEAASEHRNLPPTAPIAAR